jgi:hypothetical protein
MLNAVTGIPFSRCAIIVIDEVWDAALISIYQLEPTTATIQQPLQQPPLQFLAKLQYPSQEFQGRDDAKALALWEQISSSATATTTMEVASKLIGTRLTLCCYHCCRQTLEKSKPWINLLSSNSVMSCPTRLKPLAGRSW